MHPVQKVSLEPCNAFDWKLERVLLSLTSLIRNCPVQRFIQILNESFDNLRLNCAGLLQRDFNWENAIEIHQWLQRNSIIECDIWEKLKHCYVLVMIFSLMFGHVSGLVLRPAVHQHMKVLWSAYAVWFSPQHLQSLAHVFINYYHWILWESYFILQHRYYSVVLYH